MAVIAINGMEVPSPQTMEITWREIGKSDTNAAGQLVMDRVAIKKDLKFVWRYLSVDDMRFLIGLVNAEPFLQITCIDPATGEDAQGEYRAVDRLVKPSRYQDGKPAGYSDLQITFEER